MCKLAIVPYVPSRSRTKVMKLIRAMTQPICRNDRDAFGIAVVDNNPAGYAARWLPQYAWRLPTEADDEQLPYDNMLPNAVGASKARIDQEFRPDLPRAPHAVMAHARMATHGQGLLNAHPHVSPTRDMFLIHNGVVSTRQLDLRRSQCDSEGILNALSDVNFAQEPHRLQEAVDRLEGYYALGVLVRDPDDGNWYCDIIRDDMAELYAAYVKELKVWVYVTAVSYLREACKTLGYTVAKVVEVEPKSHVRIQVATGRQTFAQRFVTASWGSSAGVDDARWKAHMGYSFSESALASDVATTSTEYKGRTPMLPDPEDFPTFANDEEVEAAAEATASDEEELEAVDVAIARSRERYAATTATAATILEEISADGPGANGGFYPGMGDVADDEPEDGREVREFIQSCRYR